MVVLLTVKKKKWPAVMFIACSYTKSSCDFQTNTELASTTSYTSECWFISLTYSGWLWTAINMTSSTNVTFYSRRPLEDMELNYSLTYYIRCAYILDIYIYIYIIYAWWYFFHLERRLYVTHWYWYQTSTSLGCFQRHKEQYEIAVNGPICLSEPIQAIRG